MSTKTVKVNNTAIRPKLLEAILRELRQLRTEVRLLFPQDPDFGSELRPEFETRLKKSNESPTSKLVGIK